MILEQLELSRQFQELLTKHGFPLKIDGQFGIRSNAAARAYAQKHQLPEDCPLHTIYHHIVSATYPNKNFLNTSYSAITNEPIKSAAKTKLKKKFIVLHHTVSGSNPYDVFRYFSDKKFGTAYVLGGNGLLLQVFNDHHDFSYHLNMAQSNKITRAYEAKIAQESTGIEVCNWGELTERNGKIYNTYDREVDVPIIRYEKKFRGGHIYHKYTDAQIKTLYLCIQELLKEYDLKLQPRKIDAGWFDFNPAIVQGSQPLFTHTNVRTDKSDLHPQPELIEMLNELYNPA